MSAATKDALTFLLIGTILGISLALLATGCSPITHVNVKVVPYTITETVHVDGGKPLTHQLRQDNVSE